MSLQEIRISPCACLLDTCHTSARWPKGLVTCPIELFQELDPGIGPAEPIIARCCPPHRPYHTHDDKWPLLPGRVYEVDVEIWPTCIILPAGFRIAVNIAGKDFERPGGDAAPSFRSRGSGPWIHDDPYDRPASIFGGETTLHTSAARPGFLLLPIIPNREEEVASVVGGENRKPRTLFVAASYRCPQVTNQCSNPARRASG